MALPLSINNLYRFHEFELDPLRRALLRDGVAIPLSSKAFEVLSYLVQNPGRVVTKEELLKAVWPGAYVEESNLPGYISVLRKALTDRSSFIVTVPGQGYQFTAAVQVDSHPQSLPLLARADSPGLEAQEIETAQIMRETTHVVIRETSMSLPAPRGVSSRTVMWSVLSVLVVLLLAAGAFAGWRWLNPPSYGHAEAVIADLDNETGDKDFDQTLNKVLQIDLQQSPYFTIVGQGRARRMLAMMRHPTDEAISAPIAREICQRVNGQIYLVPAIQKRGDGYEVSVQAMDCGSGRALGNAHKEASSKKEVLPAFSEVVSTIRRRAGESRSSLKEFHQDVADEPTSSLEALKAYTDGDRAGNSGRFVDSIALYKHAIELDPNMSVAYADMSSMYYNMGDKVHDKEAISKAYALRGYSNVRERYFTEFRYHQSVTGDLPAMLDSLRRWAGQYPDDNLPLSDLVNFETWTGQYSEAAAHADQEMAIEHRYGFRNGIAYEIDARAYRHANLPDKMRAVYAEALQLQIDTEGLHSLILEHAAEIHNQAEVDRQIAMSRGTPSETRMLQHAGSAALADGHVRLAESLFAEAQIAARRDKLEDSLVDQDDYHARMLFELGFIPQAQALLKSLPNADPSLDKAFTEAAVGDKGNALAEAERQLAETPTDTLMNSEFVPSVRAIVAIQASKPEEAVAMLQKSAPFELRDPTVPYLRGQAFLAAHQAAEAASEFAKLADHPWIADPSAPLITLAHLGLARAFAMQNRLRESREQYEALFSLWKTADPDIPILQQARVEYDRMIVAASSQ